MLFAEEAEEACKNGNFMAAGAALLKCIARATPVAAAGAVLAVSQHSDVGFSENDIGGHKLARVIAEGEHLNAWQTKRCRKLAARYATQAMTKVWGDGGSAGAKRLRRLFKGRDPWSGDELCWGDDDGSGDEAVEAGGAADSSEEEEAEREEADSDLGGFITPDEEALLIVRTKIPAGTKMPTRARRRRRSARTRTATREPTRARATRTTKSPVRRSHPRRRRRRRKRKR